MRVKREFNVSPTWAQRESKANPMWISNEYNVSPKWVQSESNVSPTWGHVESNVISMWLKWDQSESNAIPNSSWTSLSPGMSEDKGKWVCKASHKPRNRLSFVRARVRSCAWAWVRRFSSRWPFWVRVVYVFRGAWRVFWSIGAKVLSGFAQQLESWVYVFDVKTKGFIHFVFVCAAVREGFEASLKNRVFLNVCFCCCSTRRLSSTL